MGIIVVNSHFAQLLQAAPEGDNPRAQAIGAKLDVKWYNYARIARWAAQFGVDECLTNLVDAVVLPVHEEPHWVRLDNSLARLSLALGRILVLSSPTRFCSAVGARSCMLGSLSYGKE